MKLSRRTLLQSSAAAAAVSVLPACSRNGSVQDESNLLENVTDLILNAYPESASSAGVDTGKYAALKSQLTDRSAEGQAAIESAVRDMLARLNAADTTNMAPDEALHVDVIRTVFETAAEGFEFPYGDMAILNSNWSYRPSPYVVAQNVGAFTEIPFILDSAHSIENAEDADAYLSRLESYAEQLDGETERITADGERGVILPDFLMAKTLTQLRAGRATPPEQWGVVTTLATASADMDGDYAGAAATIAAEKIAPAIDRQVAALEALEARATGSPGVWAQPDGEAYYAWALKAATTTAMSPDEVHELGREELASLHAEMDVILKSAGYTDGPVGARMAALYDDPRYKFAEGDEGRAEIMAFIHQKIEEMRALTPEAFETLVPGFLEVTRIPPEVEAGAPSAYGGAGSVDGKQPGKFWINLRDTDLHRTFTLQDLTYHEAIPGHVWQGEYTFKQPLIRSLLAFNAYSEGWALYAEQIADELGVYDDFPVGRLGYLQSLAFRACRLVVDTGLHAKRWTRQQGIDFFVVNNGSNPDEVEGEVDRYCSWPGQACGYKVGHSAIVSLREKAKAALGDKFDFRRFNDALLLSGNVPMTVLERVIDEYIEREKV